jgi:hypothetical protein
MNELFYESLFKEVRSDQSWEFGVEWNGTIVKLLNCYIVKLLYATSRFSMWAMLS